MSAHDWRVRSMHFSADTYTPYISDGDSARVLCFMNLSGAYGGFKGVKQAEDDARKMAAAPALLEALEKARNAFAEGLETDGELETDWSIDDKKLLAEIDAAIKQARGQP